jgi:cell division protein DivIC
MENPCIFYTFVPFITEFSEMEKLKAVWHFVRRRSNKYVITVLLFVGLIGFVGDSSVYQRILNMHRLMELDRQIEAYNKEYERDTRALEELKTNPLEVERTARERYFMKKPNEDVFVFEEDLLELPPGVSVSVGEAEEESDVSRIANDQP